MVDRRDVLRSGAVTLGALTAGCSSLADEGPDPGTEGEPGTRTDAPDSGDGEPEASTDSSPDEMPSGGVTVAYIADQDMRETSREVLRLISREDADVVVHSGDFDYQNDPEGWDAMLTEELGADFPYLASAGDHDLQEWEGYERVLSDRAERVDGLEWTGELGLQATARFRGITFVFVAPTVCEDEENVEEYPYACGKVENSLAPKEYATGKLAGADTQWRVCSFHRPNDDFQVSDKEEGASTELYDACREYGAITVTGHDHNYARTHLMSDYSSRSIASKSPPYEIGDGKTFSVVSGLGGEGFYETTEEVDHQWWAAKNTRNTDGSFGAFFTTLRSDGTATCYFKDVDGTVVDGPFEIELTSDVASRVDPVEQS